VLAALPPLPDSVARAVAVTPREAKGAGGGEGSASEDERLGSSAPPPPPPPFVLSGHAASLTPY
jgi:hypothetical protein